MVEAIVDIIDGEYEQYFSKKYEQNKEKHGKDAKRGIPRRILRASVPASKRAIRWNFQEIVTMHSSKLYQEKR